MELIFHSDILMDIVAYVSLLMFTSFAVLPTLFGPAFGIERYWDAVLAGNLIALVVILLAAIVVLLTWSAQRVFL